VQPFHLDGTKGVLAAIYYPTVGPRHPWGDILLVPAFAEEMNRCRAMVAMQARALAALGVGTLVLDPYGTGDSSGEFVEASWAQWQADLQRGLDWLRTHGQGCTSLWGVRLGAIMASGIASADAQIERLLLWQPVVDARAFYTQFLRIRIAAELEQSGGIKTTDQLRSMSARGKLIEVSGYQIGSVLAAELDRIQLPAVESITRLHTLWYEVLASSDANIPRGNLKVADSYRAAGARIQVESAIGPPFWQVHERAVAPELIAATSRMVAEAASDPEGRRPAAGQFVRTARASGGERADPAEYPMTFPCEGQELMGVIHRGRTNVRRGVVIVVAGGPQYRAGAHRQFVSLARKLAALGYPVLRFDLRGMGDSSGEYRGFEHSASDIRSAIDALIAHEPAIEQVVLFGECESASGILFYAHRDSRVTGIALVNPWVRTEGGRAEVIIKHYYLGRLLSRDFWRKVSSGEFKVGASLQDFVATLKSYRAARQLRRETGAGVGDEDIAAQPLPVKTALGLRRFRGPVMILMSGHDYIAREFDEVVKASAAWNGLLEDARVSRRDLPGADHSFSRDTWKRQASDWVCEWIASW
jgi:exosortase A-associated hydrolase 1/exosortase A-associated hydrolase 2